MVAFPSLDDFTRTGSIISLAVSCGVCVLLLAAYGWLRFCRRRQEAVSATSHSAAAYQGHTVADDEAPRLSLPNDGGWSRRFTGNPSGAFSRSNITAPLLGAVQGGQDYGREQRTPVASDSPTAAQSRRAGSLGGNSTHRAHSLATHTERTAGSSAPCRVGWTVGRAPESCFSCWPDPAFTIGIDLGGFALKAHWIKQKAIVARVELTIRTVVTATTTGTAVDLGRIESALDEVPERTMYDLTSALADSSTASLDTHEIGLPPSRHHVVQLLASLLRRYTNANHAVVAIAIPPQLAQGLGQKLYAVAHAAGLSRCYFINQTAALCASLLHRRQTLSPRIKPQTVIIVDCGATGISLAWCEVSDTAAQCKRQVWSRIGGETAIAAAIADIQRMAPAANYVECRELAYSLLREYSVLEEYQLHHGQKVEIQLRPANAQSDIDVISCSLGRETFGNWFQPVKSEFERLVTKLVDALQPSDMPRAASPNTRLTASTSMQTAPSNNAASFALPTSMIEVVFNGQPFRIGELRSFVLESMRTHQITVRNVLKPDDLSVSEGATLLAAKRTPGHAVTTKLDIDDTYLGAVVPENLRCTALGIQQNALKRAASKITSMLNPPSASHLGSASVASSGVNRRHSSLA
jgi:hypothetical protein